MVHPLYNYTCIQITDNHLNELVKLYFHTEAISLLDEAGYDNFVEAVAHSALLSKTFMVDNDYKLYEETVQNIYWALRLVAHPAKDKPYLQKYIRLLNPIFKTNHEEDVSGFIVNLKNVIDLYLWRKAEKAQLQVILQLEAEAQAQLEEQ